MFPWNNPAFKGIIFAMMGRVYSFLIICGILFCFLNGKDPMLLLADGADGAVRLILSLGGSYLLWMGIFNIAKKAQLVEKLAASMQRPLRRLMPNIGEASAPVSLNLAANFLGLGNAATPFGLEAMRMLSKDSHGTATREICMFLALNTSAIELLPTGVIAVRAACGSADPYSIVLPTFISSVFSAVYAVLVCKLFEYKA